LTTAFLPKEALTGWLATVASYNPVTYLLDGLRAITSSGWELDKILPALGAILAVAVLSQTLAFNALRGRTKRK